jgi:hypothetical protein
VSVFVNVHGAQIDSEESIQSR